MKRTRLVTGSMVVLALTAAACGSSGPKTLSEDDFISQMDSICRTADRAINKLDPSDSGYYGDITDLIQTGLDDFAELKAPKTLQSDFDDFTANLDDQLTQFEKLTKALKNDDTEAANNAIEKLTALSADGDDLADSIGAEKCVGVGSDGSAPVTTDTADTEPDTTDSAPDTTTADTTEDTTEDTVTPNTPLPIDTSPDTTVVMTAPPSTTGSTGGGVTAGDASDGFSPIDGYSWGTLDDITATVTPTDDPVLGPVLSGYYVGVMDSSAGGNPVYVYVTVLNDNAPWTAEQLSAYYSFELVGDGQDITLPTIGLPAKTKVNAVDGYDAAVFTIDGVGVSILTPTGSDVVALLEGFIIAQSAG